jgi:hypothetical protein
VSKRASRCGKASDQLSELTVAHVGGAEGRLRAERGGHGD